MEQSLMIEQQILKLNNAIQQLVKNVSTKETNVIVPQLDDTNSILRAIQNKNIQNVVLQNDKAFQIEYINKPTVLDYMTAYGTAGAVIVSLFFMFWNNRDQRKAFCKRQRFEISSTQVIINIVGAAQESKSVKTVKTESLKFSIFNKCNFTKLEIEKIYIDFFKSVNNKIFVQKFQKEINIYSESEITVPLSIQYKGTQGNSTLIGYFTTLKKYAEEQNLQLNLSSNPKIVIFTNFGEFNIYATRRAKKYIRREFYNFIKKNTTPQSRRNPT